MELLAIPVIGFLVVMLGALFLFGELLVRAKGVFFIVGIVIFTIYFSFHLTSSSMLWLAIIFIAGLAFVILDGIFVNDGTLSFIGVGIMALSVAVPTLSFLYGLLAVFGLIAGLSLAFLFLKFLPSRNMWSRIALKEKLTSESGFNSLNERYRELVGKEGITTTAFRPSGNIEIDGEQYSAITEGQWLEKDVPIIVHSVDGTRIVVQKKPSDG